MVVRLPPEATGRAVKEYMAVLDDGAFGAATDVVPKFVSPADPAARWTGQRDHCRCRSDNRDPAGRGPGGKAGACCTDGPATVARPHAC